MSDVTRLLDAAATGDRRAAADLVPLDYDELRKLAAARMAAESPGHPLQPTALVHEAYLRLVGPADRPRWESRGHFFAAAAEAMRRILVDAARRKAAGVAVATAGGLVAGRVFWPTALLLVEVGPSGRPVELTPARIRPASRLQNGGVRVATARNQPLGSTSSSPALSPVVWLRNFGGGTSGG
jgi:hypothetical protein